MPTINLRVSSDELAEIDRRWPLHGHPNRTAFLLSAAMSVDDGSADDSRFEEIERRLRLLEEATGPA